jgi:hypothetical protein
MTIDRRSFLRGMGGIVVALPFLESLQPKKVARAAPGPSGPKRYLSWFTFMGSLPQYELVGRDANGLFFPEGSVLAPLEKVKHKLSVLQGVNMASLRQSHGPVAGHSPGCAHAFTSAKVIQCNDLWGQDVFFPAAPGASPGSDGKLYPNQASPSIDQAIANRIDTSNVRFKSLVVGDGSDHAEPIFYGENADAPQRFWNPKSLFDALFADVAAQGQNLEALRLARKSVLDAVLVDAEALGKRVSKADALTLAAHLDSIRDIEKSLALTSSCAVPDGLGTEWNDLDWQNSSALGTKSYDQLFKLLALGLKCDLYRTAAVQFSARMIALGDIIPDLGAITQNPGRNVHEFSHAKWNEDGVEVWRRIVKWRYQVLADFAADLDSAQEGEQTVLDNTVILHGNELLTGLHDTVPDVNWGYSGTPECPTCPDQIPPKKPTGLPMLFLGSAGGALKTGELFDFADAATYDVDRHFPGYGQYSHGEIMLTMARAMGVGEAALPTFGDPEVCKSVAAELLQAT